MMPKCVGISNKSFSLDVFLNWKPDMQKAFKNQHKRTFWLQKLAQKVRNSGNIKIRDKKA